MKSLEVREVCREYGLPEQVAEVLKKSGITKLYPPQIDAVKKGALVGKNLVLAVPTASGKTLISELCMLKSILTANGKCLYIVPLRALASEKYEEFNENYGPLGVKVGITTGEFDVADPRLARYDILVATSEKVDSLLRHRAKWLADVVSVVVLDEVHQIEDPERGPTLEVLTARLRQVNPKLQVLALSACLPYSERISLEDGSLVKIGELVEREMRKGIINDNILGASWVSPSKSIRILTLDESSLKIKARKVKKLWKIPSPPFLLKIKTAAGKSVKVTAEHPLFVFTDDGPRWVRAGEIKPGNFIGMPARLNVRTGPLLALPMFQGEKILVKCKHDIIENIFDKLRLKFGFLKTAAQRYGVPYPSFHRYSKGGYVPLKLLTRLAKAAQVPFRRIAECIDSVKYPSGKATRIPLFINHDLLKFAGMVAGDGHVRKQKSFGAGFTYTISFFNKSTRLHDEFKKLSESLFSITPANMKFGNGYSTSVFSSKIVGSLLEKLGVPHGDKAHKVCVSQEIFRSPLEDVAGFIGGLFDCDASFSLLEEGGGYIRFYTTSRNLARDIQNLLLRYGVLCRFRVAFRKDGHHKRPVYLVWIGDLESIRKFAERIPISHPEKRQILGKIVKCGSLARGRGFKIPKAGLLMGKAREDAGLTNWEIVRKAGLYPYKFENGTLSPTYHFVSRYASFLEKYAPSSTSLSILKTLAHSNVSWDVVKEVVVIPRGGKWVYDLTIEGSHNFIASDFIVHNTIENANEIAEWLGAELVKSEWRPVPLKKGVYHGKKIKFDDGSKRPVKVEVEEDLGALAIDTVREGGQALVFVSTRRSAQAAAMLVAKYVEGTLSPKEREQLAAIAKTVERALGESTRTCRQLADCIRQGTAFHHAGLHHTQRKAVEDAFRQNLIKVICATPTLGAGVNLPSRRTIIRDYRRYVEPYGLQFIPVLEFHQMCGRAGRPQYDKYGEAVVIAHGEDEVEALFEEFILAEPERITSKLASEPALRTHVLASIAAGYVGDFDGMLSFISHTFFAYQHEARDVASIIERVIDFLEREGMINRRGKLLIATPFGERVSSLYIDPMSAVVLRDGLKGIAQKEPTALGFLHLVCHTPDMGILYLRRRDYDELESFLVDHMTEFLTPIPDDPEAYEYFLAEVKTARMLESWVEEELEDQIHEKFGIGAGDIRRAVDTTEWLLYSTHELARLFKVKHALPVLHELRQRVRYGVKEELLELVSLRGIGRVRGRSLFKAGYHRLTDIKRASVQELSRVPYIGPEIAKSIKGQVEQRAEAIEVIEA